MISDTASVFSFLWKKTIVYVFSVSILYFCLCACDFVCGILICFSPLPPLVPREGFAS